ncbi:lactam utilization protein LamB [Arachidicoccus ginsenosidimutans]|uniref:5-oxoprolinase subunit PxpA n=1 Tax=Arachidicoccus sp. BS20 TaxID=1850526 RepID=UPI0007F0F593|nr:5-oxoprolinase subunit PxpA [Arachidicoccus sp. BS20]ANI90421.1 lactam utilization protein LamB [Arachidicoccus sp. BS20]
MDFNCDMGEGMSNDALLMPYITSANIACGFHAGDEATMREAILLAQNHGVHIGAHVSFDDKKNFGRTEMFLSKNEIYDLVTTQLRLFHRVAESLKAIIYHVKPHGALYNISAKNNETASAIAQAVKDFNPELKLFGLSKSCSVEAAERIGLKAVNEAFADRTYQDDGSLTPRKQPNALIENETDLLNQVKQLIETSSVVSVSGKTVPVIAETICIHGDGTHAISFAKIISLLINQATD